MIRLALDWTPNTNHTGFFIAQEKSMFSKAGLDVKITDPADDNYSITPAKKLETGIADIALAPTESVISYRTKSEPFMVKAIGTVLQKDASAVTVLKSSGIKCPEDLDGKRYASYEARYEDEIVRHMIKNDGGSGEIEISYPEKLGIWNTLLEGNADATWIFLPWEGVQAEEAGVDLTNFVLSDHGIPYGYSPVLLVPEEELNKRRDEFTAFMKASREGFNFAIDQPDEAAAIMETFVPEGQMSRPALLKSQKMINKYYNSEGEWGSMSEDRWEEYIIWLQDHDLIAQDIEAGELFENLIWKFR